MKILSGLIQPSGGKAAINGTNVADKPEEIKRITGYLPEQNPLYPDMYVKEYLLMIASLYKVPDRKNKVQATIEQTGLAPEQSKKIGSLSKGYRQRVGLAQNLLHSPDVLILDEPTTGLDPNQIVEIRNLIREAGKKKTVILSSHIMQEVEAVCNRVIIINNGEIIADDTTSSLKFKTSGKVTEVEFLEAPELHDFSGMEFLSSTKVAENRKFLFKGHGNTDIRPLLFRWAVENNRVIISMQQKEYGLEEIFRKLTE
jgi:ABC-2 type transport system ATP-binding protein